MSIRAVALAHLDSNNEAKTGSDHLNNMKNFNQGLKRLGMLGGLVSKTSNI